MGRPNFPGGPMPFCSSCGQALDPQARYCPSCGQAQASPASAPSVGGVTPAASSRGCWKPLFAMIFGLFVLGLVFFAAMFGLVFLKLKNSEPARMAVQSLRQNPAAAQALGEIQRTGWPIGSFSVEGGGSGQASFSISVRGTKARGKYYATLLRENNVWRLQSSRLQLADGTSLELGGSATLPDKGASGGPIPPAAASGGQQPRSDP